MEEENEIIEPAQDAVAEETPSDVQRYEGTEESAMETAKRRMAERDAEYSAKFAQLTEEKKPAKKKVAASPKKEVAKNGYAQDIAREGRGLEKREYTPPAVDQEPAVQKRADSKPDMTPPIAKEFEEKVRNVASKKPASYSDVNGGLRSLNGGTKVPSSKKEYSDAFRKFSK